MNPPETLQIGDTWVWSASVAEYPATEWTLKFSFRGFGLSVIDITAIANGADYSMTVIAETTKTYLPGAYTWKAFAEKGMGAERERYTVGEGSVRLLPDLYTSTGATDNRSHAQKMLDAIETALEAAGPSADVISMTIGGRSVQYKRDAATRMRSQYRREVAREKGESGIIYEQFGSGR